MSLSDAQIERYSRQILLPEVGPHGQTRLLGATVAIAGSGAAAVSAATLLGRAGIGTLAVCDAALTPDELAPDCTVTRHDGLANAPATDLTIDLRGADNGDVRRIPYLLAGFDGPRATLLTLVGGPCVHCVPAALRPSRGVPVAEPLAASITLALGSLVATEALRGLLFVPDRGQRIIFDLMTGALDAHDLASVPGCGVCGAGA